MFKLNRKMEYALISLKYMGSKIPGQLTSAKEICDIYQTPFDPTARVLQIMAQHDILQAEQGAHGGYQIIKDLTKISLRELSTMITGPIEITSCIHVKKSPCGISETCQIMEPMASLNQKIIHFFDGISLGEIMESKSHGFKKLKEKSGVSK